MTTLAELAVFDVPLWPGPREYLPDYEAGWAAFTDALRAGQVSGVADPGDLVPSSLSGARRLSWIMGYGEHQLGVITWDLAVYEGGSPVDVATVHAAVRRAVGDIRAAYLGR